MQDLTNNDAGSEEAISDITETRLSSSETIETPEVPPTIPKALLEWLVRVNLRVMALEDEARRKDQAGDSQPSTEKPLLQD